MNLTRSVKASRRLFGEGALKISQIFHCMLLLFFQSSMVMSTSDETNRRMKPRQALNAYNIFFQYERKRILEELSPRVESESVAATKAPISPEEVQEICRQHKIRSQSNQKRSHRRVHGKISFRDLAKTIAIRWRALNAADKAVLETQAAQELRAYHEDLHLWEQEQEESVQHTNGQGNNVGNEPPSSHNKEQPKCSNPHEQHGHDGWTPMPVQEVSLLAKEQEEQQSSSFLLNKSSPHEATPSPSTRSGVAHAYRQRRGRQEEQQAYLKDLTKLKHDIEMQLQACMMEKGVQAEVSSRQSGAAPPGTRNDTTSAGFLNLLQSPDSFCHQQYASAVPFASFQSFERCANEEQGVDHVQEGWGHHRSFLWSTSSALESPSSPSTLVPMVMTNCQQDPFNDLDEPLAFSPEDQSVITNDISPSSYHDIITSAGLLPQQQKGGGYCRIKDMAEEQGFCVNEDVPFFTAHEMDRIFED